MLAASRPPRQESCWLGGPNLFCTNFPAFVRKCWTLAPCPGELNDLITKALAMRAKMESGQVEPSDDDSFVVYHASARLSDFSTGVHRGTLAPRKLVKDDGTVQTQVINTVRISDPGNEEDDASSKARWT